MKKNFIIAFQILVIVGLVVAVAKERHRNAPPMPSPIAIPATPIAPTTTVGFPDITLGPNEHITQAELQFEHAIIRGIRNIPPSWYISISLDPPPNPTFKGNIEVGAAAVDSVKELPIFEIERYVQEEEARATKAVFMIAAYPGDGKERKIEIEIGKP